jgi:Protein of unknown function (DUF3631)
LVPRSCQANQRQNQENHDRGAEWGKAARDAAIELSREQDEDLSVQLLADIRDIFDRSATLDRLGSAVIVQELVNMAGEA